MVSSGNVIWIEPSRSFWRIHLLVLPDLWRFPCSEFHSFWSLSTTKTDLISRRTEIGWSESGAENKVGKFRNDDTIWRDVG
jgi:hypothetical protein